MFRLVFRRLASVALLVSSLIVVSAAQAALVVFDFNALTGVGTNNSGGAISVLGDWGLRDIPSSPPVQYSTFGLTTPNSGAVSAREWNDRGTSPNGNAWTFSFTVAPGSSVTFTDGSFLSQVEDASKSPAGATWTVSIRDSSNAVSSLGSGTIASNTSGGSLQSFNPTDLLLGPGTYTLFLAANSSNTGPSNDRGWRIDNFTLNGSFVYTAPVPLPAAAWLLLSGLAGVGAMARRRKTRAA